MAAAALAAAFTLLGFLALSPAAAQTATTRAGQVQPCFGAVAPPAPFLVPPTGEEGVASAGSDVLLIGTAGTSYSLLALSTGNDPVRRVGHIGDAGLVRLTLPLPDGQWLLGATVADSCGLESTAFNTVADILQSPPQVEQLVASIDGSTLSVDVATDRPATLRLTVLDDLGAVVRERTIVSDGLAPAARSFSVPDGEYQVRARATDAAGRTGATQLLGDPLVADVTAPELALGLPVLSLEPESVSLRVVAEAGASVSITGRGLPVTAEFVSTGVAREYQFATEAGDYTVEVTAVDANGNVIERSVRTRVRPQPTPIASPPVVGASIAALLLATALLWRWLRSREAPYGESLEAAVLRPQNA